MLIRCDRTEIGPAAPPCGCALHSKALGRRGLLRGAAGFGLAAAGARMARAQGAAAAPTRIDVHHHYTSPGLLAMMKGRRTNQGFNMAWTVQKSLDAMDAAGVATAIVSTSDPGVFFGDYDAAKALARDCNEYQAGMVADHKGRFGMFTTLPLPDVDNTLAEIAYGLDVLKAQGVGMMTSYGTKYLGDPAFVPVMEELNRRRAVEYGTETSRTIASLLMNHTTIRFPDIRFIFSHGGGDVPFLTFRFARMVGGDPELMKAEPGGAVPLIQKLYFDTAQAWNQYTLPSLTKLMPVDHILFGSDFPAASPLDTVNGLRAFGLDEAARARIERLNAMSILTNFG
jgi:predicted TIM-barrel fold metal-dependent hydrolase